MSIEMSLNQLGQKWYQDWFFGIGISYDTTKFTPPHKHVVTIALLFFSIYIRF